MVQYIDIHEDTLIYSKLIENLYIQMDNQVNWLHIYYEIVAHHKVKKYVQNDDSFYAGNRNQYNNNNTAVWNS